MLTLHSDSSATNVKSQRFDDPKIYESEKPVSAETVTAIKKNIALTGMLAWSGLPDNGYQNNEKKTLTFVFENNETVTVQNNRLLPIQLQSGFFNIELEMTIKH